MPDNPVSRPSHEDAPLEPPFGGFFYRSLPSRLQLFQDAETALWFLAQGYTSAMELVEEIAIRAESHGFLELAGRIRQRVALRLDSPVVPS